MTKDERDKLTSQIIAAAIEVHRHLGPGLLENTYRDAMMIELRLRQLKAEREVKVPLIYKGNSIWPPLKADIVVENEVIVELKATDQDNKLFAKQLLTYLRLSQRTVGLLINFHNILLKDGIKRVINGTE